MPARHDTPSPAPRRPGTTALDAVVASTPATSIFAALGLAGGGYLTGREDVAACGAVVGVLGLVVERLGTRGLRVRLRRERAEYRREMSGVAKELGEVQRVLASLRSDLDGVRSERDAMRDELAAALSQLSAARVAALTATTPAAVVPPRVPPAPAVAEVRPIAAQPVVASPAVAAPAVATSVPVTAVPAAAVPAVAVPAAAVPVVAVPADGVAAGPVTPPPLRLGALLPGQFRSPIATGGIPVLAPGPTEPVRVVDLREAAARRSGADDDTQPLPIMTPELVDALVYAAMAEAEARKLAHALAVPGRGVGRHAGELHTGDAHHAGDFAREEAAPAGGAPTLVVVKRGRHVA